MPVFIHAMRALNVLLTTGTPFDTAETYLPLARALLENSDLFFSNEKSLYAAPGNYVYMALLQADLSAIKVSNLGLSLATLLLVYDGAYRLAGRWAGFLSAWLFALNPLLIRWTIPPQSESFFVPCVTLWIWCVIVLYPPYPSTEKIGKTSLVTTCRMYAIVTLGGLSLSAATLTRGTYLYWIPAALLVCVLMLVYCRRSVARPQVVALRRLTLRILCLHSIALLLVGLWVWHNHATFDRPVIANGAGAALYFGANPILGGYEPPYHGVGHDNWLTSPTATHLSSQGDDRLKSVALAIIQDTPVSVTLSMYMQKLGAFLFFSRTDIAHIAFNERAWRILLLTLAALGIWFYRSHPATWLITGTALYQTSVHLPVQYNVRYSSGAIELQLMLLAGLGVASLIQSRRPWVNIAATVILILLGIFMGSHYRNHISPVMPNLDNGPHQRIQLANIEDIQTKGLQGNPFQSTAIVTEEHFSIIWPKAKFIQLGFDIFKLGIDEISKDCRKLIYTFGDPGQPLREGYLDIRGLAPGQAITRGVDFLRAPHPYGTLTLHLECPIGSRIRLNELATYQISMGIHYGARTPTMPKQ